jgi:dTDP-4-amino-4,6-dideoxygalactose transaminase
VAAWYEEGFRDSDAVTPASPHGEHVYNLYTIRSPDRDGVKKRLQAAGIGFSVCYELPLHRQQVFDGLGYAEGDLPHTDRASRECISLPVHPYLTGEQVGRVVDVVLAGA